MMMVTIIAYKSSPWKRGKKGPKAVRGGISTREELLRINNLLILIFLSLLVSDSIMQRGNVEIQFTDSLKTCCLSQVSRRKSTWRGGGGTSPIRRRELWRLQKLCREEYWRREEAAEVRGAWGTVRTAAVRMGGVEVAGGGSVRWGRSVGVGEVITRRPWWARTQHVTGLTRTLPKLTSIDLNILSKEAGSSAIKSICKAQRRERRQQTAVAAVVMVAAAAVLSL